MVSKLAKRSGREVLDLRYQWRTGSQDRFQSTTTPAATMPAKPTTSSAATPVRRRERRHLQCQERAAAFPCATTPSLCSSQAPVRSGKRETRRVAARRLSAPDELRCAAACRGAAGYLAPHCASEECGSAVCCRERKMMYVDSSSLASWLAG